MRYVTAKNISSVMLAVLAAASACRAESGHLMLSPATMPRIGSVDTRFQSYNVAMVEVTGGRFWKPYGPELTTALKRRSTAARAETPVGMNPNLFDYRPPIDLQNPRLRKLTAALGPAYLRVSGTWANTTYFPDPGAAAHELPAGFSGELSPARWQGVVDFAGAVDAGIITSFAISAGVRNADGAWTPEQATRLAEYTRAIGGRIVAAEFMNAPNQATMGGAPQGYDAAAYGRDFKLFHAFARRTMPDTIILGPGSMSEIPNAQSPDLIEKAPKTRDLLSASSPDLDGFSYHHYGALSRRCADLGNQTSSKAALSQEWLARTDETLAFFKPLRDAFAPDKPIWLTETGEAACGGNPWAATFLDTFRYLDQLGRLARQGVNVVVHNTLAGSDYGLLSETTFTPRPNYWSALVWKKLMGPVVLDPGKSQAPELHVYAHCMHGKAGGVVTMAINPDRVASYPITVPMQSETYTLSSARLQSSTVELNNQTLQLALDETLPAMAGAATAPGLMVLPPSTITFVAIPDAGNPVCL